MGMFDDNMLKELAETKVSETGTYLKPRSRNGKVVLTGFDKKDTEMKGAGYFLSMRIVALTTAAEPVNGDPSTNTVGEDVSMSFFLEDGSRKKKDAVKGALIRAAAAVYESVTGEKVQLKDLLANTKKLAAAMGALEKCRGLVVDFSARDSETEAGEGRTYHNLVAVKNTAEQVKKARELLDSGAPIGAFA